MNVKNITIFLLVIALLTLYVPNVVAASANKQTTETHSSYAMATSNKEKPKLALILSNNTTAVNTRVDFIGALATDEQGALHYIGGATVTIQQLNYDGTEWNKLGTIQTFSTGKEAGFFGASITPQSDGYYILRATYDGDSNYAPAVSNVVALTVTN